MSRFEIMEKTITETLDLLESNDPYLSQPINSARINYLGQTNHVRQPPRVQNVKDSFGAGNPNPNLWLPTSHFPKKKPLSTPKNPIKKDNQPDPFIDKFIEEIANVLSGRGEEKKDDDSEICRSPSTRRESITLAKPIMSDSHHESKMSKIRLELETPIQTSGCPLPTSQKRSHYQPPKTQ